MKSIKEFILILLMVNFTQLVAADELLMKNGDRITGTLIGETNDVVSFETSYAGILKVDWAEVDKLLLDEPTTMLLKNDSTLDVTSIQNEGADVTVQSAADKSYSTIPLDEFDRVAPEDWELGKGFKLEGRMNLALKSDTGNTDQSEVDIDGDMQLLRKDDRVRLVGQWEHDETEDETTKDKLYAVLEYNRFYSDKFYYGALSSVETDEFADLKLRTVIGPIVGYQFYKSYKRNLDVSAGVAYVHEKTNESDTDDPGLMYRINYDQYVYRDWLQFYHRQSGLYKFDDEDDNKFIFKSWIGFRTSPIWGFVSSVEAQYDWDSNPPKDTGKSDTVYRVKLGYQW